MRAAWLLEPEEPVPYTLANEVMHHLGDLRAAGEIPDTLILLEHTPVYTAGRRSENDHLVWGEDRIRGSGADYVEVDRGGSVTFHGPGQLVGYPILDLGRRPDLAGHITRMEETIIRAGERVGVDLDRDPVQAGVWSGRAKVCAIGVRLARWRITLHGFGLNCDTDLSWFDAIVPCGLPDRTVTSLSELAGRQLPPSEMRPIVASSAAEVFDLDLQPAPLSVQDLLLVPQEAT